jgi:hypothetical protein
MDSENNMALRRALIPLALLAALAAVASCGDPSPMGAGDLRIAQVTDGSAEPLLTIRRSVVGAHDLES